jgi:hypothetical protein
MADELKTHINRHQGGLGRGGEEEREKKSSGVLIYGVLVA